METGKLIKMIVVIFLAWLVITYIPNRLLHNWIFVLFIFADFYFSALWLKKKSKNKEDIFINVAILGLLILGIASIVLNRFVGF